MQTGVLQGNWCIAEDVRDAGGSAAVCVPRQSVRAGISEFRLECFETGYEDST